MTLEDALMKGSTFKRCGCRDPATGKQLGSRCPKLGKKGHASWWARHDLPPGPNGERRQSRIGPFRTKDEAEAELAATLDKVNKGVYVQVDRALTIRTDFDRWFAGKRKLKASTRRSYQELGALCIKPGLGHLRLIDLRQHHIEELYAAMRRSGRIGDKPPSSMLNRLLEARTSTAQAARPLSAG